MRKKFLKKAVCVCLAAVMMVSLAGCGGNSESGKEKKENAKDVENKNDMTYEEEEFAIEGITGEIGETYVFGEKMYVTSYVWDDKNTDEEDVEEESEKKEELNQDVEAEKDAAKEDLENKKDEAVEETNDESSDKEEENGESAAEETNEIDADSYNGHLYVANLDGSDLKEIALPKQDSNEWMNQIVAANDDKLVYLFSSYDEKSQSSTYSFVTAGIDGEVINKQDITKSLNLSQDSYINKIFEDENGEFVVITDNSVKVMSQDGKSTAEINLDKNTWMEGCTKTKDGKIIVGASDDKGAYIQEIDVKNKKLGEKIELNLRYFGGNGLLEGRDEYDFFYKDETGIYGYKLEEKKEEKILDYMASNINSDNAYDIIPFTQGRFLGRTWDESGTRIVLYHKVDPSTIKDKQVITVAMLWIDDTIKRAALEFNKQNDKYQIEIKDYSKEEDSLTKLNADIVAGNVADIICLNQLPIEQYVQKGVLEDLTPYFEKDSEIKEEDIIDSFREAMKIDGKIYYLTPSFYLTSLVASKKEVGSEMGWTFDDFMKYLEKKGKDVRPFYSENKDDILRSFGGSISVDFVDWSTGECYFNTQDFKDILEVCNQGTNEEIEYNEDSESMPSLIKSGKVLFLEGSVSIEEIQVHDAIFGGECTYIGYPSKDKQGTTFESSSNLGIYSKSDVKDGAWEFLRSFMTKKFQGKMLSTGYMWGCPTRKDAFELSKKIAMATEKFKDEYGNEHEPRESEWGWDDLTVKIKPATQEQMDLYVNLIENTHKIGCWNDAILDIISEECKPYFKGDKTVDETADIIQNRVKTYVNENR